ncbi:CRISPR-associated protein, Cas5h family [Lachnospiraceae bacterium TWA4]|nr:CRISPR-associated protein, Cas5h family [Lachnospiraceae bacterium TWA4]
MQSCEQVQVLYFKLQGKMAHFRKYYSNSTALSYYLPPVTTIKGILAGLLGYDRDTYYEDFSNEKCQIAIGVDTKIKKIKQTMNLLKVESKNQLCGAGLPRTQNDTEWIIPENIRTGFLSYSILVKHSDSKLLQKLAKLICSQEEGYYSKGISVALGSAQCLGWISDGKLLEGKQMELKLDEEFITPFAVPLVNIEKINSSGHLCMLRKEETMTEFDSERYITLNTKQDLLVSVNQYPMNLSLKEKQNIG